MFAKRDQRRRHELTGTNSVTSVTTSTCVANAKESAKPEHHCEDAERPSPSGVMRALTARASQRQKSSPLHQPMVESVRFPALADSRSGYDCRSRRRLPLLAWHVPAAAPVHMNIVPPTLSDHVAPTLKTRFRLNQRCSYCHAQLGATKKCL